VSKPQDYEYKTFVGDPEIQSYENLLNEMADDGWEPFMMSSHGNGDDVAVMLRRLRPDVKTEAAG
jgi:hypothetical protein